MITHQPARTPKRDDSLAVLLLSADQAALNQHMPVDHMMGATVEGKESATAPAPAANAVSWYPAITSTYPYPGTIAASFHPTMAQHSVPAYACFDLCVDCMHCRQLQHMMIAQGRG